MAQEFSLHNFLVRHGLLQSEKTLCSNEFDTESVLATLTIDALKVLEITKHGAQRKFLMAVSDLKMRPTTIIEGETDGRPHGERDLDHKASVIAATSVHNCGSLFILSGIIAALVVFHGDPSKLGRFSTASGFPNAPLRKDP